LQRYTGCTNCEAVCLCATTLFLRKTVTDPHRLNRKDARHVSEQGFTLVELLVVLAILGLLIALVAPAMIRQLGSAKL
jgi:prepilin-type N-terminal cleavage/methylation domain-containing protein